MLPFEIESGQLRPLQIIHLAVAGGVFLLLVIAVVIPGSPMHLEQGEGPMTALSMVHVLAFFAALGLGRFMFDAQTRREKLDALVQGATPDVARMQVFGLLRRVYIIRLALLEGASFFGLAVVLIGKMTGVMEVAPIYWLNALSAVFLVGFVIFTFPMREKLEDLFR